MVYHARRAARAPSIYLVIINNEFVGTPRAHGERYSARAEALLRLPVMPFHR